MATSSVARSSGSEAERSGSSFLFHGSCRQCHHLHKAKPMRLPPDSQEHRRYPCEKCGKSLFGIGRRSTKGSLASQLSMTSSQLYNAFRSTSNLATSNLAPFRHLSTRSATGSASVPEEVSADQLMGLGISDEPEQISEAQKKEEGKEEEEGSANRQDKESRPSSEATLEKKKMGKLHRQLVKFKLLLRRMRPKSSGKLVKSQPHSPKAPSKSSPRPKLESPKPRMVDNSTTMDKNMMPPSAPFTARPLSSSRVSTGIVSQIIHEDNAEEGEEEGGGGVVDGAGEEQQQLREFTFDRAERLYYRRKELSRAKYAVRRWLYRSPPSHCGGCTCHQEAVSPLTTPPPDPQRPSPAARDSSPPPSGSDADRPVANRSTQSAEFRALDLVGSQFDVHRDHYHVPNPNQNLRRNAAHSEDPFFLQLHRRSLSSPSFVPEGDRDNSSSSFSDTTSTTLWEGRHSSHSILPPRGPPDIAVSISHNPAFASYARHARPHAWHAVQAADWLSPTAIGSPPQEQDQAWGQEITEQRAEGDTTAADTVPSTPARTAVGEPTGSVGMGSAVGGAMVNGDLSAAEGARRRPEPTNNGIIIPSIVNNTAASSANADTVSNNTEALLRPEANGRGASRVPSPLSSTAATNGSGRTDIAVGGEAEDEEDASQRWLAETGAQFSPPADGEGDVTPRQITINGCGEGRFESGFEDSASLQALVQGTGVIDYETESRGERRSSGGSADGSRRSC